MVASLHHFRARAWNSGWSSQKCSNLKGFHPGEPEMSSESCIGQWSEPEVSKMLALIDRPSIKRVSDTRNRSR
jgi:hypothetical protein